MAVLLVDTDRVTTTIDQRIYGQFLEHINHSVEDGLFAEQIRGAGFEGDDFKTYWEPFAERGRVELANVEFQNGKKSVRLRSRVAARLSGRGASSSMRASQYEGSLWVKREKGSPHLTLRVKSSQGEPIASVPLASQGSEWQEVPYSLHQPIAGHAGFDRDCRGRQGRGAARFRLDDARRCPPRRHAAARPAPGSCGILHPSFIRWPGGSFASTYKWKEGIGRYAARGYHPNTFWGGYSDYLRLRDRRIPGALPQARTPSR